MSWQIFSAATAGATHEKHLQKCGDAVCAIQARGYSLCLIADGAGSVSGSEDFAENLVSYVKDIFQEGSWMQGEKWTPKNILLHLYESVRGKVSERAFGPGDSTLLALLIADQEAAFLQVGDGFCVVRENGHFQLISDMDKDAYANETDFIGKTQIPSVKTFNTQDVDFFALSSDGLTQVALRTKTNQPHIPFFEPFSLFLSEHPSDNEGKKEIEAFLKSDSLRDKVKDDVSLIIGQRHHD
ncbi:MAG: hypothetical protein CMO49_01295 [Verrucomicrobiales bacterium]|nr:hypothetical protein [Verrucomicrobiales bacterium]|tara:strand:- start:18271 stop:18993 length:723 start_codon:yes stop_codon:yes gene_type:complete